MANKISKVGGHLVREIDGINEIELNERQPEDVKFRDLFFNLKRKTEIARYNVNRVYPTAVRSDAFAFVSELEKAVEHFEKALTKKREYIKHIHGYDYKDEMILTGEDIF